MKYRPELDGIRALSIAAVVGFHVAPAWLPGGFVGVDVFFVLSGFLITTIVNEGIDAGVFSLSEFYLRRMLRLLPNLAAMVAAVVATWFACMPQVDAVRTAEHALWTLGCSSNVYVWKYSEAYWGGAAKSLPLLHAWSLGIEEQFYLLYPLLLVGLARWCPRVRGAVTLVLAGAGAAACVAWTRDDPQSAFYLLPTRSWELLAGAILARSPRPGGRRRVDRVTGVSSIAILAACLVGMPFGQGFPGWIAWLPVLATMMLVRSAADGGSWLHRILSLGPLTTVGKMSYSIYLWHWPAIVLGTDLATTAGIGERYGRLLGGAVGVALGAVAYRILEVPMRDTGVPRRSRIRALCLAYGGVAAAASCIVLFVRPVADPRGRFDVVTSYADRYNAGRHLVARAKRLTRCYDVDFRPSLTGEEDAWRRGGIVMEHGRCTATVLVVGDSHAQMYGHVVDTLAMERGYRAVFLGVAGTPLFPPSQDADPVRRERTLALGRAREEAIRKWRPRLVFCCNRWDVRDSGGERFERQLAELVALVRAHDGETVFVGQCPVLPVGERRNLREWASTSLDRDGVAAVVGEDDRSERRALLLARVGRLAREMPGLIVIDPRETFLRDDGSIRYLEGRRFLYIDDDHLSEAGAQMVRPLFAEVFDRP